MSRTANYPPTAEMQALDAAHHLHPFTNHAELAARGARVITAAEGVWLTDSEGNRILDGMAGLWCVNIGYGRAELAEAAARQMRELPYYNTFFQTTHPPAVLLAERLARLAPEGLDHVFYSTGGSDANDTNIRLVRLYWERMGQPERQVIISRHNAYHGSTMGAASLGGMAAMHAQGGLPIPGIEHIMQPHWWAEAEDGESPEDFGRRAARALEEAIDRIGPERVAAFIAEPVQGAGAVIVPPESYWPEVARICAERGILLISDEVICGFGRTGWWWGAEGYGVRPDIMTVAKGMSSGYAPIGGSIVRREIAEAIADVEFFHGYTYSGHPVSCAVALENLRIMEEERIVERVATDTGPYLAARWAELGAHPLVGEVRIRGMMAALQLTPDKAARAPFAAPAGTVGLIGRERAIANGLVMRHVGDSLIIAPP
ncbi:MAG: aminotransferase class III-fold pyridoxal phosphate-dependent enzyme, partial [Alphaproteobacteria bacterium]